MDPLTDIDSALDIAAEEALGSIRQMMQRPVRLAPFAIVMGLKGIVTMPILDLEARVPAIRFAVAEVDGHAFVIFYDGLLAPYEPATNGFSNHREALFRLQMTHTGHGRAIAYPYRREGGVVAFGAAEENPESLDWLFEAVFRHRIVN